MAKSASRASEILKIPRILILTKRRNRPPPPAFQISMYGGMGFRPAAYPFADTHIATPSPSRLGASGRRWISSVSKLESS